MTLRSGQLAHRARSEPALRRREQVATQENNGLLLIISGPKAGIGVNHEAVGYPLDHPNDQFCCKAPISDINLIATAKPALNRTNRDLLGSFDPLLQRGWPRGLLKQDSV